MLRAWARQADERAGASPRHLFPGQGHLPTEQEELRRLQRENARLAQESEFPKRNGGVLREGVAMRDKYAAIPAERARFWVRLMCAALGVSPSGYYAAQLRAPSERTGTDARLRVAVRTAFTATKGRYGAPRIYDELTDTGERTSEKRIARPMQEAGLVARRRRRFISTTDSDHAAPVALNLLAGDFAVGTRACNTVWVTDMTYVPTQAGFLDLAVVLDLASRRVVGWAMDDTLETPLPLAALRMAITRR